MNLIALPAFADNCIWMLHGAVRAVVVDPGDAAPVQEALGWLQLQLVGILVTHHHADHVGGVDALRPLLQGPVYGPRKETIPTPFEPFEPLDEGDRVQVLGLDFGILDVPGHTGDHIAYAQHGAAKQPLLFCGDTLFSAGCGRLFEDTPAQMHQSLSKFATLPADTRVCGTHEYTLSNLRFAAVVEPGNAARASHQTRCETLRANGQPTLPSSIGLELAINPFLRCSVAEVVASANVHGSVNDSPVAVLTALREWKNRF